MPEMMARVEAEDFDVWLNTHREHSNDRASFGMTDGPIYRDIQDPKAALVHIHVEDLERAMQWFQSAAFKEATQRATVVRRDFYLAEKTRAAGADYDGLLGSGK